MIQLLMLKKCMGKHRLRLNVYVIMIIIIMLTYMTVENPPTTNAGTSTGSGTANNEEQVPGLSWPSETFDAASGDEDSLMGLVNTG